MLQWRTNVNPSTVGFPDAEKLKEIIRLQESLWEAAQRPPEGVEKDIALREVGVFQTRLLALVRRLNSASA